MLRLGYCVQYLGITDCDEGTWKRRIERIQPAPHVKQFGIWMCDEFVAIYSRNTLVSVARVILNIGNTENQRRDRKMGEA